MDHAGFDSVIVNFVKKMVYFSLDLHAHRSKVWKLKNYKFNVFFVFFSVVLVSICFLFNRSFMQLLIYEPG